MEWAGLRNAGWVVTSSTFSAPMYTVRPSLSCRRCSLPFFSTVVVDLVEDAAAVRSERTVVHARRPAGVGGREALLAAFAFLVVADDEIALHYVDLLPMVMHERLGGEGAGVDLEQARAAAFLRLLVQVRGEDLLPEPLRVTLRSLPAARQVHFDELQVLLGLHGFLHTSSLVIAWWVTVPANAGKFWKLMRERSRSRENSALRSASADSNSNCTIITALPRVMANGSFHSTCVCSMMRFKPGHAETSRTCSSRK